MSNARWVAKHRGILLCATAAVGVATASWLHAWGERDARCGRADTSAACHEPTEAAAAAQPDDDDRVAIPTDGLPHKGARADLAKVTMIECSDYGCPYSKRAAGSVDELLARNEDLAFHHLHFPLGSFAHSVLKARVGVAAQRQGRFWSMHDALFDARIESDRDAVDLAARLGLDAHRFAADLRDPALHAEVDRQRGLCKAAGVRAVPTFFINGRRVVGSIPTDQFQRVIDEERP